VLRVELEALARGLRDADADLRAEVSAGAQQVAEVDRLDDVASRDTGIVRVVGKEQGQDALLAQVRLGNARNRAGEDQVAAKEARLECGVLARGALAWNDAVSDGAAASSTASDLP
jgi:hypothetical protein